MTLSLVLLRRFYYRKAVRRILNKTERKTEIQLSLFLFEVSWDL